MKNFNKAAVTGLLLTTGIATVLAPTLAMATDTIIVTATKRAERITDVPIAITAIGGDEIDARGAITLEDLQYSVPGLNIQGASPGASQINLRGVNPGSGTGLPVVGVYVDEVGITVDQQQRNGSFPLVDLERIEVLRGPQGTLYGQGSVAGTIRYITRSPNLEDADGYIEGNLYHQEEGDVGYRASGAFGAPIAKDVLGLRVAAGYDMVSGWVDYPLLAPSGVEDANDTERWYVRPKLLFKPNDQFTASILYQYLSQESDADNIASLADRTVRTRTTLLSSSDKGHLLNGILEYDFGPATIVSSTGYQDRDLLFDFGLGPTAEATSPNGFKVFNQELRIASNGEGRFNYLFGGFYRDYESEAGFFALATIESQSWAIFGEASYDITDRLDVTFGGRYFEDDRGIVGGPQDTFDTFTPKFSASMAWTEDFTTYATVSKGFRSGGFNGTGSSFGPETLWNYEIGSKASLLDGDLFVDLVVYYADYIERQGQTPVEISPGIFIAETTTGASASGIGFEGALTANLGAGLQFDGTVGFNDLRYDTTTVEAPEGERISGATPITASASLSQNFPLNENFNGMWRVDFQYADATLYNARLPNADPTMLPGFLFQSFTADPQSYLNIRIGVEKGPLGLYFDGTNLLNEDASVFPTFPIAFTQETIRVRPRSWGVTLRYDFQ